LFVSFACAKERTKEKHTTKTNRYFFFAHMPTPLSRKNYGSHFSWTAAAPASGLVESGIRFTFDLKKIICETQTIAKESL
jgi:hypothetical protein